MTLAISAGEYDALLRVDLTGFIEKAFQTVSPGEPFEPNWHVEAMAEQLRQVHAGEIRRLLITVPPRHLKSITASVAFPAWALGLNPATKFLVASYGGDLAAKHAGDFRSVIRAPWYRRMFPRAANGAKKNTELEFETADNGSRRAVSLGGAITGLGSDILIIDDLMKAGDAGSSVERQRLKTFYEQTLYSRLNDKRKGAIIAIQQRLHEDDLAAYLIEKGDFVHLNLKAIAEEDEVFDLGRGRKYRRARGQALFESREPLVVLEQTRQAIGPWAFSAQYQQNPTPPDGNLVRWTHIKTYDEAPDRERLSFLVHSWDVAVTATPQSDWSVCTSWGFFEKRWYLLDLLRLRREYPDLLNAARTYRRKWRPDLVLIEKAGAGRPFFDDFRQDLRRVTPERGEPPWRVVAWDPRTDKISRLAGQTAKLESGQILLPRRAPFLADLKAEMIAAPNGRYDDQVDSVVQFSEWVGMRFERSLDRGRPA